MKKIGIVTRKDSPEVTELLGGFVPWLKKNGAEVTLEPEVAQRLGEKGRSPEEMAREVEAVIVLGGDGTMLGTARLMARRYSKPPGGSSRTNVPRRKG
ncbi:MAG: NAD(+)/NADH kinase [Nitrospirota bacterium]